ncbi:MAG: AMP-binding protein [Planctomycetes bacterium]|nr:AMP-binding protein [Planctomycetota bacterium]MBI3834191.1 AMP-binding protein [Planctomycetota bacterium]
MHVIVSNCQVRETAQSVFNNDVFNIASHLGARAKATPDQLAVIPSREHAGLGSKGQVSVTFASLERLSNQYANALNGAGIGRGTRTMLMVRPGVEFLGLVFAMFKCGVVPVMIDPGMGVRRLLECVQDVKLQAFVGIPAAHAVRVLSPRVFASVRHVVTVGRRWFWGGPTLKELADRSSDQFEMAATHRDEIAAILFTSGSTGPAKGVVYTHGMFDAQVRMIQAQFGIQPGEIDLPTFPLFGLFSIAMGMTVVIPEMDPSRPVRANPRRIVNAIQTHGVTNTFGSPAVWRRIARYCVDRAIRLPTLRRILIAGAPVPSRTIEELHQVLDSAADVHTPYGATEALPVCTISGRIVTGETLEETRIGVGTCVGRLFDGIEVRIIRINDNPIANWSDELLMERGQVGEIVVRGQPVTHEYFNQPEATARAKIQDGETIWHRMGDVGYIDEQDRLWFCGRKNHRVETSAGTLFTECVEPIFNEHPAVHQCALVGVGSRGQQVPAIVVEPNRWLVDRRRLKTELAALAMKHSMTSRIRHFLFRRRLPVDVRHNAKINREALAVWAARITRKK